MLQMNLCTSIWGRPAGGNEAGKWSQFELVSLYCAVWKCDSRACRHFFFLHLWSFLPYYLFVKCFYKQKMWEGHCTLSTCVLACYVQITGRIIQSAYIASSYMCPGKKNQCQQIKGFIRYLILLQCYINKYCPPQKSKLLQEYFCRYYKMPPFFRVCFDG